MTISRPCQRCGAKIARGRLCDDCRYLLDAPKRERHAERMERLAETAPTATAVWRSAAWTKVRAAARARDGGCVIGGACAGKLHGHHVVRIEDGGEPYDLANVVTLCSRHHRLVEEGKLRLKSG